MTKQLRRLDGLPVVDAIKPTWFEIGAEDISYALRKNGDYCAAAMALCRDDKIEDAFVHLSRAYVHNRWVRYLTPANLRRELIAFDKRGVFKPGSYRLGAPSPTCRLGNGYQTAYGQVHPPVRPSRKIVHRVSGVRERAPRIVGDTFTEA